jgi:hypothetical protein
LQPQPPPWAKEVKRGALFAKEEVIEQIYHATPLHYDPPTARSFAPVTCHKSVVPDVSFTTLFKGVI